MLIHEFTTELDDDSLQVLGKDCQEQIRSSEQKGAFFTVIGNTIWTDDEGLTFALSALFNYQVVYRHKIHRNNRWQPKNKKVLH